MSKKFCICRNCGNKFDEKDAIKVKRGYKVETHCPKCDSFFINGYIRWTDDIDSEITTEIEPLTETKSELKFKTGNRVFNKVTRKWVNIIEFDIETGLYIVRYDDGIKGRSLESELCETDQVSEIKEVKNNKVYTMDKWEYMYVKIYISELTSFLNDFNKYGKDGWELCAYSESNHIAVFKRKIKE